MVRLVALAALVLLPGFARAEASGPFKQFCDGIDAALTLSTGAAIQSLPWPEKLNRLREECPAGRVATIPADQIAIIGELCDWSRPILRNGPDVMCRMR